MLETFREFVSGDYAPHGYCLLWQPALIWTHVISDALIAAAYFSIPIALVRFVRQRTDVAFGRIIWLFALFILACGTTHLMGIWNLWHGDYGMEAVVKAVTATASVPTAILLWRLVPQALAVPSPTQLQLANDQLRASVAERDRALRDLKSEIVQRERAEAALVQAQKLDAIGQLTGGIAHDFNNLLQAAGGNVELIKSSPGNPDKVARWADNAINALGRGTRLTGQLLAFSRTQRLELRPVELNSLIIGMQELIISSVGSPAECQFELQPGLCHICGDPTQLELAILNLAINARDAMPNGGVLKILTQSVTIAADEMDLPAGAYVELVVNDTGVGMPPEIVARALDPFFTTKGVGSGTGLGLSMAFGVAAQSGGTLRIKSTVGQGTSVTLVLPCTAPPEGQADAQEIAASTPFDALVGLKVAIVDDDADVRQLITESLALHGAVCDPFDRGEPFLAKFTRSMFDLILLDFAMPGLSGAEIAKMVRRIDPAVPVIILTGYAASAALDEVVGDVQILRKPISTEQLLSAVRRFK